MTNFLSRVKWASASALLLAGMAACNGSHQSSAILPQVNQQINSRHPDATVTHAAGSLYVRGTSQLIDSTGSTTISVPAGTAVGDCLIENHVQIGGTFAAPKGWGTLAGPTTSAPTNTSDAVYGHIVVSGDPTSYSWTSSSNPVAIDMMYDVVGCKSVPSAYVTSGAMVSAGTPEQAYVQKLSAELGIDFFTQLIGTGTTPAYVSPTVMPTGYTLDAQSIGMGGSMDGLSMFGSAQATPQIEIGAAGKSYSGGYQVAAVILSSATAPPAAPTASPLAYLAISAGNMNPAGNYRYDYTNPENAPTSGPIFGTVQTSTTSSAIDVSGVSSPAPQAVYQHYVNSGTAFTYDIPGLQPSTTYPVRLHFAEIYYSSAGQRSFNVSNAGNVLISNLDPYAAAGGKNKAYAVTVNAVTNAQGHLVLVFAHSGSAPDGPCINGIEINPSAAPATPAPTTAPTYPIYSNLFTGNTPFHHTVAQLIAAGATMRSSTVATNFYKQAVGVGNPYSAGGTAIYSATASDPAYTFMCPAYGGCTSNGATVHCPLVATPADVGDHHLVCEDSLQSGEVDGWGGYNCTSSSDPVVASASCPYPCTLTPGIQSETGSANCSYGGFAPYSGTGLGVGAVAGGYAFGLMDITAQELINGKINHALGLVVSCVDSGYYPASSPSASPSPDGSNPNGVYPGMHGTDSDCTGSAQNQNGQLLKPNVVYGDLVTINPSVNVTTLGYGKYCLEVIQALQTYGAYIADTNGGYGVSLEFEDPLNIQYPSDPWGTIIFPSMVASGDASDGNYTSGPVDDNLATSSCLQRIPSGVLQVYEISSKLPAQ